MSKDNIQRHFSAAAQDYDKYAIVQRQMSVELLEMAKQQGRSFQRILEIGCGTGILTEQLLEAFPQAQLVATDISESMLQATGARLQGQPRLSCQQLDGEQVSAVGQYDLVISNAVFQWFTDYEGALARIYTSLEPGGCLLYATFGQHTFWELGQACQQAYRENGIQGEWQHGPKFKSEAELCQLTGASGFRVQSWSRDYYEYHPGVREFLQSVKNVGANNTAAGSHRPITRRVIFDMMRLYEENYRCEQGVRATSHIIFVAGQK